MNTSSWTRPVRVVVEDTNEIKTAWLIEVPRVVMVLVAPVANEGAGE